MTTNQNETNNTQASEGCGFTANENGTVTITLCAHHASLLAELHAGAMADNPMLSMVTKLGERSIKKLREDGEDAKADELQALLDEAAGKHEAVDYSSITSAMIEATHEAMVQAEEMRKASEGAGGIAEMLASMMGGKATFVGSMGGSFGRSPLEEMMRRRTPFGL